MLIEKPIAFESLDFLPGFPTLSKYTCNPFSTFYRAGACANPPQTVGRERTGPYGFDAMVQAIKAAGGVVPNYSGGMSGLGKAGDRHIRHDHFISGLGASGRSDRHARFTTDLTAASAFRPRHGTEGLGGCGCGGSCGGCGGGLGQFDASSIMSWISANWMPLAIGGAAVWFLKRR